MLCEILVFEDGLCVFLIESCERALLMYFLEKYDLNLFDFKHMFYIGI